VLERYPIDVKLTHKFVPAHDFSLKAATAALAAGKQGKFWEFHDKLFENQSALNDAKVMEIARSLKLNLERFRKKLKDPALEKLVNSDYDEAKELGVLATPWVYVNGRHLEDRSFAGFVAAIDGELKK
jgi:protein-disulfide isomerase